MNDLTFLDQPLDRGLYEPKNFISEPKEPLRILVTNAGRKIAYNIIYQICKGNVFGENQDIILHLINSKGSIHHKAIVLELEQCGFSVFKDCVVSSSPEVIYGDVDIVVVIATFEELPGLSVSDTLGHQIIKARQVVKFVDQYAKKNTKIIFTGPSTKALLVLLTALRKLEPDFPSGNLTTVTTLDVTIAKASLGAKLQVATKKIKNLIVWSVTYPDIRHATVRKYPLNDFGATEMIDIPVSEVLDDQEWLFTFGRSIYRRFMLTDLLKYGKAVAMSTVTHLKALFLGSENLDEIPSMGVITSDTEYCLPSQVGCSFPVETKDGYFKIMEGVPCGILAQLNILRVILNLKSTRIRSPIVQVVTFMINYENTGKHKSTLDKNLDSLPETWVSRYFITANPAERISLVPRDKSELSRKSIVWDHSFHDTKLKSAIFKSSIKFNTEKVPDERDTLKVRKDTAEMADLIPILTRRSSVFIKTDRHPLRLFEL